MIVGFLKYQLKTLIAKNKLMALAKMRVLAGEPVLAVA
jgi:hypothetical protein